MTGALKTQIWRRAATIVIALGLCLVAGGARAAWSGLTANQPTPTIPAETYTAATYAHNALGQRVIKTAGAATTHDHYDRDGRLLAESDGTGATIREYIHLDGLPLALVTATGEILYVHADHLATPRKMTDAAQQVVWDAQLRPFGEAHGIAGTAANDQRFPGQLFDAETGFHYNYFRDYDPGTGRYLQSDPIGLAGGLNTYAYALGNPVNYVDPDGRNPLLLGIIGGAVGGALFDAGQQLLENGGQFACLDYGQIARSAIIGGALGGLGQAVLLQRLGSIGKTTKEVIRRNSLGADGASSRHVIERLGDDVISVTHQVSKKGKIIHQHQNHIGKYGTRRQFPEDWLEYPTK